MEQVLDLRRQRLSYRAIGKALGLDATTVHECHQRALKHIKESSFHVEDVSSVELRRIEESEYIDGQLRRYQEIYDLCMREKRYRNAIEALNGAHRYLETLVKLRGIAAPQRHQIQMSMDELRAELVRIEAEIGPITDEEVAQHRQLEPTA